ncbi:hypothetical protein LTR37_004140 [Vermiconidia calcicola]|uniref:Uncharacterized protein n=1 Tax=Vermiconidia calcicola TaxID=1690605 RepID=A0ACC3NQC6_9PEZI|nr:hypothetical protein LTR37_004140 [Vermiconidia calcicola]
MTTTEIEAEIAIYRDTVQKLQEEIRDLKKGGKRRATIVNSDAEDRGPTKSKPQVKRKWGELSKEPAYDDPEKQALTAEVDDEEELPVPKIKTEIKEEVDAHYTEQLESTTKEEASDE